ncbi:hypothetical protein IAD21_01794 [Abditibacteriota bacterium]|nr:hypothetical protein IAD21_01794 [Abditibacteriota bacterium]
MSWGVFVIIFVPWLLLLPLLIVLKALEAWRKRKANQLSSHSGAEDQPPIASPE